MTLKMKGKTDVTAGRATAARRGVGGVHHLDARFSWLQQLWARRRGSLVSAFEPAWRTQRGRPGVEEDRFDSTFERTTPSHPMSSSRWSLRMVAVSLPRGRGSKRLSCGHLEREKRTRDEWLVLGLGMVTAILTVFSGVPFGISSSDDCSQQKETEKNAAWRRQMKRARTPCWISKIQTTA